MFEGKNLFILCYVISEIYDKEDDLSAFTKEVAQKAPIGSKFLFVDRDERKSSEAPRWLNIINGIAREANLELSDWYSWNTSHKFEIQEHPNALGQIYHEIKRIADNNRSIEHAGNPAKKAKAFWVVGTKMPF